MKILWLVNITMPDAAQALHLPKTNMGGWLIGQLETLAETGAEVVVCSPCGAFDAVTSVKTKNVLHILLPGKELNKNRFLKILQEQKPDMIHIFGTEFSHSLFLVQAAEKLEIPVVVSLQGIISEYAKHYLDGIPSSYTHVSFLCRQMQKVHKTDIMVDAQADFVRRGVQEVETLRKVTAVIGRTAWDKRCALAINPQLRYFHVNENLRSEFYTDEHWQYSSCAPYSIFISQANYPIKGLHQLLKALPKVIAKYPNTQVRIGGWPPVTMHNALLDRAVDYFFDYQGYLHKLMREGHVENHITYLGPLNAQDMKQEYLRCNVFVSPSSIENSPNSVGEAMILAAPIVASNVGGVSSMLDDEKDGILYDFFDIDALSEAICAVFAKQGNAEQYGKNARLHALQTHDRAQNTQALLEVYQQCVKAQ